MAVGNIYDFKALEMAQNGLQVLAHKRGRTLMTSHLRRKENWYMERKRKGIDRDIMILGQN